MTEKLLPGLGLDVGTRKCVAARYRLTYVEGQAEPNRDILTGRMRDAFLDLPIDSKRMLKLNQVNYVEIDGDLIVVGDPAIDYANLFGKEARRPLQAGLIAAGEIDAIKVLGVLMKHVLKTPQREKEICYFSVPAAPVDSDRDVVYHKGVLERIISECGFDPIASNEAMAIIFSEAAPENFSAVALSFGSGMTNVALALEAMEGLSFSVGRGGDWIDQGAARSMGATAARMCALKEAGIDLMTPESREQEALTVYYKAHIEYVLEQFIAEFVKIKDRFAIPKALPIIVSGGTALAGGFLDFFKQTFEAKKRKFPIEISEIRMASNPLNAVAQGLLVQAALEYDED